ncbi:hypothetical protein [Streptomyces sp. AC154]|uniref:hypothetical protein n=1 Tax=Streptomyces sp. AC154 TaxID=3143184 RepID=UPI003F7DC1B7
MLQLNPWLTVAGTSAEQGEWKGWNAANGPACVIPAPDYPAEWRAARAQAKKKAGTARRREKVVALPRHRQSFRKASA